MVCGVWCVADVVGNTEAAEGTRRCAGVCWGLVMCGVWCVGCVYGVWCVAIVVGNTAAAQGTRRYPGVWWGVVMCGVLPKSRAIRKLRKEPVSVAVCGGVMMGGV